MTVAERIEAAKKKNAGAEAQKASQPSAQLTVQERIQAAKARNAANPVAATVKTNEEAAKKTGGPVLGREQTMVGGFGASSSSLKSGFGGGREAAAEAAKRDEFSAGKLAGGILLKGADELASGLTSTGSWLEGLVLKPVGSLLGDEELEERGLLHNLNDVMQEGKEQNQKYFRSNVEKGGKIAQIADKYGTATVAAVPQALLALATAGGSTVQKGLQAASKVGGGVLSTLGTASADLLKNPQYWLSFLQVTGDSYDQAIADGTDETKASLYAMANGLLNAAVEVGGGIQTLPAQLREGGSAMREWISSMVDEGKEEVVQGIIERGMQNVVYDRKNALASATDENAILNPRTAAEEFAGGAVVGGILGGGQVLAQSAVKKAETKALKDGKTFGPRLDEGFSEQKTASEEAADSGVTASSGTSALESQNGLAGTLVSNVDGIKDMQAVANLTGNEMNDSSMRPSDQIHAYFKRIGGTVSRTGLGQVSLGDYGVGGILNDRPLNGAKMASIAAVPDVIRNGKQISYDQNRKGHGDARYVFAAPVEIAGTKTYVAAVVDQRPDNKFYLSEVVDSDGNYIRIERNHAGDTRSGVPAQDGITTTPNGVSFDNPAIEQDGGSAKKPAEVEKIFGPTLGEKTEKPAETFEPTLGETKQSEQEEFGENADDLDALSREEPGEPVTQADRVKWAKDARFKRMEAPPETDGNPAPADLDEYWKLVEDTANPFSSSEDARKEAMDRADSMVHSESERERGTMREEAENARSFFMRKMVDAGDSVSRIGKAVKDRYLYSYYNMARSSASAGINMIGTEQTDVNGKRVGDSLNAILDPIRAKGTDYYDAFQQYLLNLHNINRMGIVNGENATAKMEAEAELATFDRENPDIATKTEQQLQKKTESSDPEIAELAKQRLSILRKINQAERIGNKPVFGYDVTPGMSREKADTLLRQHPEFADYQKQVRGYINNLMRYRVDSGLMTQADADFLEKYYPNYVPTYRRTEKEQARINRRAVRTGKTVGRAEGGDTDLLPLHEALGKQTMSVVREGSKNRFGQRLLQDWKNDPNGTKQYISDAKEYEAGFGIDTFDALEEDATFQKSNTYFVYKDGKLYEMEVDPSLFDAVKALSPEKTEVIWLTKLIRGGNNLFKKLVTGMNPMFTIRNVVRDAQTAGLYSRDLKAWGENYPLALREIAKNGAYWKQYKALGGSFSSVFNYQTGTIRESSPAVKKTLGRVEALNMAMEQAPRLAEFMSIVKKGDGSMDNLMDAMHAAADVTVNFGRSGTVGKFLNANFVPFLNPGIQGLDRMARRVTETRGAKEWAKLTVRAAALGVAPALLNALLYSDDDDWKELKNSDKDTNYLFKIGDGLWLKIPKGRELSVLGMTAQRIRDLANGKEVDWRDYIATVGNQVAPANPLKTNIVSAYVDTDLFDRESPGKTWYGGDIESQRLQNYAPGKRYDSSTDLFSKWLGGTLNLSPKKINYILDQYSGVVGDFVLPLMTPQAERNAFVKAFTVDSTSSNRISGEFYDRGDEITYAKNDGDTAMGAVSRFWGKQTEACSKIYAQIREIEDSQNLTDDEKRKQVREAKAVLNGIQKNAMAAVDAYEKSVRKHLTGTSDEAVDRAYREANRECFGAEYAIETYHKDTYEEAQEAHKNGVSYQDYYTYYFDTKNFESSGGKSAATKKMEYLQIAHMSDETKAEIYFASLASDSDLTRQAELETKNGITPVEYWEYKAATAGISGDKDALGKTVSRSKQKKVLAAIDGLDLTKAQKTALYYANEYAESTLNEAPWMKKKDLVYPSLGGSAKEDFQKRLNAAKEKNAWKEPTLG